MRPYTRLRSGEPTRVSCASRDFSIKRNCQLQMNERHPCRHVVQVRFVDLLRFLAQQPDLNCNACRAEMSESFAGNFWIEILDWRHDTLDSRSDQRISARRCATVMRVRFERDICSATASFLACDLKRNRLCMLYCFKDVKAFTNNLACRTPNHTTPQWSGTDLSDTFRRQLERTRHHASIGVGPGCCRVYNCRCLQSVSFQTNCSRTARDRRRRGRRPFRRCPHSESVSLTLSLSQQRFRLWQSHQASSARFQSHPPLSKTVAPAPDHSVR